MIPEEYAEAIAMRNKGATWREIAWRFGAESHERLAENVIRYAERHDLVIIKQRARVTREMLAEAMALHRAGVGFRAIARRQGVAMSTIHKAVTAALADPDYDPTKTAVWTPEAIETLRAMAPTGCGAAAISRATGINEKTIRDYASKRGISIARAPQPTHFGRNCGASVPDEPREKARASTLFKGVNFGARDVKVKPGPLIDCRSLSRGALGTGQWWA